MFVILVSLWHARVKAKKNISLFHNQTRYIIFLFYLRTWRFDIADWFWWYA